MGIQSKQRRFQTSPINFRNSPRSAVFFLQISTFDKSYSQFERLYMMIVKQLIEAPAS
jgi:hypothetical protein